jgi:hypothetical protein
MLLLGPRKLEELVLVAGPSQDAVPIENRLLELLHQLGVLREEDQVVRMANWRVG